VIQVNLLSRTRRELRVGLWALAAAVAVVVLFLTWPSVVDGGSGQYGPYDSGYSTPLTASRALQLFGTIVLAVIAAGMMLSDLWRRPVPRGLRKLWTVLIVLGAPFGGLAYWLLHCHGAAPVADVKRSA
jgi:hypothetical protein